LKLLIIRSAASQSEIDQDLLQERDVTEKKFAQKIFELKKAFQQSLTAHPLYTLPNKLKKF